MPVSRCEFRDEGRTRRYANFFVVFVSLVVNSNGGGYGLEKRTLSDVERRDWLRLARAQNVGPVTFAALIARFHSASTALAELPRLARRGGAAGDLKIPGAAEAARELEATAKLGGRIIASIEPDFPFTLAALDAPPPLIAVSGNMPLLSREMIAVVGARNASALGRKFAAELASGLGNAG